MVALLLLAGGLGRRFGGDKQLVAVGPAGEIIADYAIRDALAAGADRIVVVTRSELDGALRDHLAGQHGDDLPYVAVHQDAHGPPRARPWGTAHAVAAAGDAVDESFVVANADDWYGPPSIALAVEVARRGRAAVVAFRLGATLPDTGAVNRAVCVVDGGRLAGLSEQYDLRAGDGRFPADALVSLNLWAFPRWVMPLVQREVARHLADHTGDPDAELLLPDVVGALIGSGELHVDVVESQGSWLGVTSAEDLDTVRTALRV